MSQNYKFKSLEIAKNGQEKKEVEKDPNDITVFEIGETRTIDFILKDGTRQNFAYAHYMTAWIGKDEEAEKNERYIKIFFATHLITIKGYYLDKLYDALINLSVKSIKVNDERYLDMVAEDKAFVTDVKLTWKKEED
ncbi:hypothetical protein Q4Q34_08630 [Flavivirga abyssicola]|uniref:hypothetical protein n=1 Tax=Flavivirga abyssicola TaxID=3063533 RepID=UPI0026DF3CBF|nr:hypothetical protein [Flavivirga sp. MEBiC07777]WVK15092.1 hypothetical protein Q4Q34_08630 [Flavivirga sp. MEBiC07777]